MHFVITVILNNNDFLEVMGCNSITISKQTGAREQEEYVLSSRRSKTNEKKVALQERQLTWTGVFDSKKTSHFIVQRKSERTGRKIEEIPSRDWKNQTRDESCSVWDE